VAGIRRYNYRNLEFDESNFGQWGELYSIYYLYLTMYIISLFHHRAITGLRDYIYLQGISRDPSWQESMLETMMDFKFSTVFINVSVEDSLLYCYIVDPKK